MIKPIGRVWNASQKWATDITNHSHMTHIIKQCNLDDSLYIRNYKRGTKTWTTAREMAYDKPEKYYDFS